MKGITLWQPWASAIVLPGIDKNIENRRTLLPPLELIERGEDIAIHAGGSYGMMGYSFPPGVRVPGKFDAPRFAVVGTAKIIGALDTRNGRRRVHTVPSVVGEAYVRRLETLDQERWWLGPIGWLLVERRRLHDVVFCSGKLGVWTLHESDTSRVVDRLERERAA